MCASVSCCVGVQVWLLVFAEALSRHLAAEVPPLRREGDDHRLVHPHDGSTAVSVRMPRYTYAHTHVSASVFRGY